MEKYGVKTNPPTARRAAFAVVFWTVPDYRLITARFFEQRAVPGHEVCVDEPCVQLNPTGRSTQNRSELGATVKRVRLTPFCFRCSGIESPILKSAGRGRPADRSQYKTLKPPSSLFVQQSLCREDPVARVDITIYQNISCITTQDGTR